LQEPDWTSAKDALVLPTAFQGHWLYWWVVVNSVLVALKGKQADHLVGMLGGAREGVLGEGRISRLM
jgi:hypothetical protein